MRNFWIIFVLAVLFYIPGLGAFNLTNPDEVFYALTAREMAQQHSWNLPYLFGQPQFEKPILSYWLIRLGQLLFGETAYGARFFMAAFSVIGVLGVFWYSWIGLSEKRKAFLSALVLMSSGLYFGIGRIVLTDTFFAVFILLSLTAFLWSYERPDRKFAGIILAFIFSALAVLTKGPLGFILPAASVLIFLLFRRDWIFLRDRRVLIGAGLFLLIALPWYVIMIQKFGATFIQEFFYNDHIRRLLEAEHPSNDKWYFYPLTMIGGLFPWSIALGAGTFYYFREFSKGKNIAPARQLIVIWVLVVLVIFQCAHSKLVSYILPLFPALALITGDFLDHCLSEQKKILGRVLFFSIVTLLLIPGIVVYGYLQYPEYLPRLRVEWPAILLYGFLLLAAAVFLMRGRMMSSLQALALPMPLIFLFIVLAAGQADPYASSKESADFLTKHFRLEGRIICSKMFLRGVAYYSGREVALLDINGAGFFSPHPVPILNEEQKLVDFLKIQPVAYAVVNKHYWGALQGMDHRKILKTELLMNAGDEHVVRLSL